jgi:carbamoyl-phosphate synthase large subunit
VKIRTTALYQKVPVVTTMAAAQATVQGLAALKRDGLTVQALQDYHNNK